MRPFLWLTLGGVPVYSTIVISANMACLKTNFFAMGGNLLGRQSASITQSHPENTDVSGFGLGSYASGAAIVCVSRGGQWGVCLSSQWPER